MFGGKVLSQGQEAGAADQECLKVDVGGRDAGRQRGVVTIHKCQMPGVLIDEVIQSNPSQKGERVCSAGREKRECEARLGRFRVSVLRNAAQERRAWVCYSTLAGTSLLGPCPLWICDLHAA